jgi:hypothetical protein
LFSPLDHASIKIDFTLFQHYSTIFIANIPEISIKDTPTIIKNQVIKMSDSNQFTTPFAITKAVHRDPYPAISPERPENSQSGKIIIITGGGSGIGAVSFLLPV